MLQVSLRILKQFLDDVENAGRRTRNVPLAQITCTLRGGVDHRSVVVSLPKTASIGQLREEVAARFSHPANQVCLSSVVGAVDAARGWGDAGFEWWIFVGGRVSFGAN